MWRSLKLALLHQLGKEKKRKEVEKKVVHFLSFQAGPGGFRVMGDQNL